jgi:hypothetical protein
LFIQLIFDFIAVWILAGYVSLQRQENMIIHLTVKGFGVSFGGIKGRMKSDMSVKKAGRAFA